MLCCGDREVRFSDTLEPKSDERVVWNKSSYRQQEIKGCLKASAVRAAGASGRAEGGRELTINHLQMALKARTRRLNTMQKVTNG